MRRGRVTFAGTVEPGDAVLDGDEYVVIDKINRAQGRKPKVGENLHLFTDGRVLKVNSTDPVRVRRQASNEDG